MVSSINREEFRAAFDQMDQALQTLCAGGQLHSASKSDQLYALEFLARVGNSVDAAVGNVALAVTESGAFDRGQFLSGPVYAAFVGGTSVAEGHRVVDTARNLREFPQLSDDFSAGLISSEKVRAIVDAAVVDPSCLDDLLDLAREDTTANLKAASRRIRAHASEPKSVEEAEAKSFLKIRPSDPFGGRINGYLTNEMIGQFLARLKPATNAKCKERFASNTFISRNHCQAEALVELVASGGSSRAPRPHVNFTVSLAGLENSKIRCGELCEIPGVGPVPFDRIKQLLDDAYISLIVDGQPASRPGRYANTGQKRALDITGRQCTLLGCDNSTHLERDHNIEVRDGGGTSVQNLNDLCAPHHTYKTRYRMKLVGQRGRMWMVPLRPEEMWSQARAGPNLN